MLKKLYLVRHAEPDFPDGVYRCLGQHTDLPLGEEGKKHAENVGKALRDAGVGRVFTSPLSRTRETAEMISGGLLPVNVADDLIELDGGEWDGLTLKEIKSRYAEYFKDKAEKCVPPGGESDEDGLKRALRALKTIEQTSEETAAMVTHAGIGRILLAHLMQIPLADRRKIQLDQGDYVLLEKQPEGWRVPEAVREEIYGKK